MVFYYASFVAETNAWWLRRVRPIWAGALGVWLYSIFYRYYFFGKVQAYWQTTIPEDEWRRRAQVNKRDWGYKPLYMPHLERSRKKQIYDVLGVENYRKASEFPERYMGENRTLEEILSEEENWE
mmetsp:Transcript_10967/g.12581  ORF Transcript_10967/g.12581 Transcript_10967/m.12581 type:complete len:125 (-) Transcript_10967:165-539(-)|eukprot:CAMPEP_0176441614 /NCGR_PEP_ID=MMETSP0127-20121128/21304_1 /TAXON_ID=938130 /ORGANISM="Platyophrya macrostoma, Strain WH" /LENGTH=124 /DNA_ID=CAMNT_0017826429 /DNA_START=41 /DNA_END=415 /DNA_ORIENTATION=-